MVHAEARSDLFVTPAPNNEQPDAFWEGARQPRRGGCMVSDAEDLVCVVFP
jgi:hypothetical protein